MATPIEVSVPNVGRNAVAVKATGGTIYSYNIVNPNNYPIYVKFYDKLPASVNPLTDAPDQSVTVPALSTANNPDVTYVFGTAISVRCVTGPLNAELNAPATLPDIQVELSASGGGGSGTVTGSSLTSGNVITGSGASAIGDGGVPLSSLALVTSVPSNLSELTVNDRGIARTKFSYTNISLASVTSGGVATLAPGNVYNGDISANLTFAFSPALTDSDAPILIYSHITAALTLAYPSAVRNSDSGFTTSLAVTGAQYAVIQFSKTSSGNIRLLDNITNTPDATRTLGVTIDGAGSVCSTGQKGYIIAPFGGTITAWSITAVGASPTCTLDVWKIAAGTALPTVANTIMGTKPALSTGNAVRSTTRTGWTTTFSVGDIFGFNLDAVSTATRITFELEAS
jgi:hypothetical protein